VKYSLKDIASNIAKEYPDLHLNLATQSNQIILSTSEKRPKDREVIFLLTPYYQTRITNHVFSDEDMQAILIEVERFCRLGH